MPDSPRSYSAARRQLIAFLRSNGFTPHPSEVFCPSERYCWVDVAALKGQDYWAFEYKSRNDSVRRGFEQCCSYAKAFNYVVLVADRHRTTSSPYFAYFKRNGFGVWRHTTNGFYTILNPKRRTVTRKAGSVVERQFMRLKPSTNKTDKQLSEWFATSPVVPTPGLASPSTAKAGYGDFS